MTEPWFYAEHLPDSGDTLRLSGDEAHHARGPRRIRPGDALWLFDGRGGLARAIVLRLQERGRTLELRIEDRRSEPTSGPTLHLACALPKGDRQHILLDMTTQLGVRRFTPLFTERSVVKPGTNSADRWRKICIEACKQSRRPQLPVIETTATVQEVLKQSRSRGSRIWIAHPGDAAVSVRDAVARQANEITLLVGPEGGFTHSEVEQVRSHGGGQLTLGKPILRIETAAAALLSAFALCAESSRQNAE